MYIRLFVLNKKMLNFCLQRKLRYTYQFENGFWWTNNVAFLQEQLATGESEPTREDATSSDIITGPAGNSDVNKNHTNTEQNKFTKQTSRKKDKVVKDKKCYSDDQNIHKRQNSTSLSLPTKGTIKKTKVL